MIQSVGRGISQTGNINNLWSALTGWHYQRVSRGVKCLSSDPLSCGLTLCSVITVLLGGGAGWAALQGRLGEGEGEVTGGGQACGCVYVCVCVGLSGECCAACWPGHPSDRVHPSTPPPPHPPGTHTSLPHLPHPGPISAALCQAWNLHINFSSVAP